MSDQSDRDFVILPRDLLFEFFGSVALVPMAPDEDCAPKATRIQEWVDEHDLSGLYLVPAAAETELVEQYESPTSTGPSTVETTIVGTEEDRDDL
jgi:hypothetical protein